MLLLKKKFQHLREKLNMWLHWFLMFVHPVSYNFKLLIFLNFIHIGDNLLNTFWKSIRILSNQKEIQNSRHNAQNIVIITRFSKNKDYERTLGELSGEHRDINDPDVATGNYGFDARVSKYCRTDDDTITSPKIVPLRGILKTDFTNQTLPWPDGMDYEFHFEQNDDNVLVTQLDSSKNNKLRVRLVSFELIVRRVRINTKDQSTLELLTAKKSFTLLYNRFDSQTYTLPPGRK